MKAPKKILTVTALLACIVISVAATQSDDPHPPFKNLKVLPKDISHEDLDKVMDNFNFALGVKCGYCHARNDSTKRLDPASDAKPEKEMAREMMRMTNELNMKYFNPDKSKASPEVVTCVTCHRQNPMPPVDTMPAKKPKVDLLPALNNIKKD